MLRPSPDEWLSAPFLLTDPVWAGTRRCRRYYQSTLPIYVATVGNVTEDAIKKYIRGQYEESGPTFKWGD